MQSDIFKSGIPIKLQVDKKDVILQSDTPKCEYPVYIFLHLKLKVAKGRFKPVALFNEPKRKEDELLIGINNHEQLQSTPALTDAREKVMSC